MCNFSALACWKAKGQNIVELFWQKGDSAEMEKKHYFLMLRVCAFLPRQHKKVAMAQISHHNFIVDDDTFCVVHQ